MTFRFRLRFIFYSVVLAVLVFLWLRGDWAQYRDPDGRTPLSNVGQVARGEAVYKRACASCHGADLRGRGEAPSLRGWEDRGAFYAAVLEGKPHSLGAEVNEQEVEDLFWFVVSRERGVW